jgi:hypothetical protein
MARHWAVVRPSHQRRAGRITLLALSRKTDECICPERPMASIFRLPTARLMARIAPFHQSAGLCSAQPGCGTRIASGSLARATVRPRPSTTSALTLVVPTSMPRNRDIYYRVVI